MMDTLLIFLGFSAIIAILDFANHWQPSGIDKEKRMEGGGIVTIENYWSRDRFGLLRYGPKTVFMVRKTTVTRFRYRELFPEQAVEWAPLHPWDETPSNRKESSPGISPPGL